MRWEIMGSTAAPAVVRCALAPDSGADERTEQCGCRPASGPPRGRSGQRPRRARSPPTASFPLRACLRTPTLRRRRGDESHFWPASAEIRDSSPRLLRSFRHVLRAGLKTRHPRVGQASSLRGGSARRLEARVTPQASCRCYFSDRLSDGFPAVPVLASFPPLASAGDDLS